MLIGERQRYAGGGSRPTTGTKRTTAAPYHRMVTLVLHDASGDPNAKGRYGSILLLLAARRLGDRRNQIESVACSQATEKNRFSKLKRVDTLHSRVYHSRI